MVKEKNIFSWFLMIVKEKENVNILRKCEAEVKKKRNDLTQIHKSPSDYWLLTSFNCLMASYSVNSWKQQRNIKKTTEKKNLKTKNGQYPWGILVPGECGTLINFLKVSN